MTVTTFHGNFTQQEALPDAAIDAALEVLRSGRLHRYNTVPEEVAQTVLLEQEFRDYIGSRYALACASGGYALTTALAALPLPAGAKVLTNGFSLAPVPGSIVRAGGIPVLVECTQDLVIDLHDLQRKAEQSNAQYLLLSHMRGHIVDMDRLRALCLSLDITLIEDCAHTMGAKWDGVLSGRHGVVACYSTQTYKHINSGEGGLLVTDDADLMARATVLSGSYMFGATHLAGPPASKYAEIARIPNCSGRMDNLRAAILRPQLQQLDAHCIRWNRLYQVLADSLCSCPYIYLPVRDDKEYFVGSSLQFLCPAFTPAQCFNLVQTCAERGVVLKWFGAAEALAFTSVYRHWEFVVPPQELPQTDAVTAELFDLRLPLTFSKQDVAIIGTVILEVVAATV